MRNRTVTGIACQAKSFLMSAAHWGEVAGITRKLYGLREMEPVLSRLGAFGFEVVAVDGGRAVRAALIEVETGIPYLDSFAVELAARELNCVLVTADFDFKAAKRDVKIEFLPAK